jgi:hypothetical protein
MTWIDDEINDDHQRRQTQNPFAHGHPLALRMPLMMRATIQQCTYSAGLLLGKIESRLAQVRDILHRPPTSG